MRPADRRLLPAVLGLAAIAMPALLPVHADAQGFAPSRRGADVPCVLDKCLSGQPASGSATRVPGPAPSPPFGPAPSGAFDFYVLALSWSPGFCDTGGEAKAPDQCASGRGLGFVVHGLWPQNTRGFPSDCDSTARSPSRMALDSARGLYPDEGLARHEWRTHGTCTGLSPTDYFAAVRRARDAVTVPPSLARPDEPQTLAPLDIARAFAAANAGLRPDTMAVTCRQGELQEVRLCMAKDLRGFVPCPEVARAACRSRSVSVLPVR